MKKGSLIISILFIAVNFSARAEDIILRQCAEVSAPIVLDLRIYEPVAERILPKNSRYLSAVPSEVKPVDADENLDLEPRFHDELSAHSAIESIDIQINPRAVEGYPFKAPLSINAIKHKSAVMTEVKLGNKFRTVGHVVVAGGADIEQTSEIQFMTLDLPKKLQIVALQSLRVRFSSRAEKLSGQIAPMPGIALAAKLPRGGNLRLGVFSGGSVEIQNGTLSIVPGLSTTTAVSF